MEKMDLSTKKKTKNKRQLKNYIFQYIGAIHCYINTILNGIQNIWYVPMEICYCFSFCVEIELMKILENTFTWSTMF